MSDSKELPKESKLVEKRKEIQDAEVEGEGEDENVQLIEENEHINIDDLGIDFDGFQKNKSIELLRNLSHVGLRTTVILLLNIGIFLYERLVRETNIGHVFLVVFIYDAIVILEAVYHVILIFTCKSKCLNRT